MKILWVAAGVSVVLLVFFGLVVSFGSVTVTSLNPSSPILIESSTNDVGEEPSPTPTPRGVPKSAGDCFNQANSPCQNAANAAVAEYSRSNFMIELGVARFYSAEYVEWPDGCLGVNQPGVLCLQSITPGYRIFIVVDDVPPAQYLEYHTDLNGNAVLYSTMMNPPGVASLS